MVTYTVEVVGESYRSNFGLMINIYYAFGFMLLSAAGYLSRDWINLMKISILFHIPALLHIFLPKSPLWLESIGRNKSEIKLNYEKLTGKELHQESHCLEKSFENISDQSGITMLDILSHKYTLRMIILNSIIICSNGLTYFGLRVVGPESSKRNYNFDVPILKFKFS